MKVNVPELRDAVNAITALQGGVQVVHVHAFDVRTHARVRELSDAILTAAIVVGCGLFALAYAIAGSGVAPQKGGHRAR